MSPLSLPADGIYWTYPILTGCLERVEKYEPNPFLPHQDIFPTSQGPHPVEADKVNPPAGMDSGNHHPGTILSRNVSRSLLQMC